MKEYNFDELIDRRGTGCVKWDEEYHASPFYNSTVSQIKNAETTPGDIIPMWVADMDFAVSPAIQEAIRRRAQHPVFGYTHVGTAYYDAIISWFRRRHQWEIKREEIIYTTGVVPAMSAAIKALTMPGEKVLILSPDYNCFFSSIRNNGCEVLESALISHPSPLTSHPSPLTSHHSPHTPHHFEIDWDDFEAKCADVKTTVFLLCNPHNPTGRVWKPEELQRMNDICMRHGVKVVSDEIHCDLMMPGHRFQPFAAVNEECRSNSVILNSPSKSFNIAGLMTANIICADPTMRRRIERAININEVCDLNPFGPVALIAAYNESEEWIDALCEYIWGNYLALRQFFNEQLPQCIVTELEGTYLPWIDVSAMLPMHIEVPGSQDATIISNVQQLCDYIMGQTNVWVNPGTMYGTQTGKGFIRINIACPREQMMQALRRVAKLIA